MTTPTIDDTRSHLAEIPDLATWLPRAIHAKGSTVSAGPVNPLCSPAPYNLDARRLLERVVTFDWRHGMRWCPPSSQGVQPYLRGWAAEYRHRGIDLGNSGTILGLCAALVGQLGAIAALTDPLDGYPTADDTMWAAFATGIRTLRNDLRAATRKVRPIIADPVQCPACHDAHLAPAGRDGATTWRCPLCGHQIGIRAVTIADAAQITGHSRSTLYYWAKQGRFARVVDDRGRKLYDLASIEAEVARARLEEGLAPDGAELVDAEPGGQP